MFYFSSTQDIMHSGVVILRLFAIFIHLHRVALGPSVFEFVWNISLRLNPFRKPVGIGLKEEALAAAASAMLQVGVLEVG